MDKSNPIGKTFNKLTVIAFSHSDPLQHRMWRCRCECGTEKVVATRHLGVQISCGCMKAQGTFTGAGDIMGTLYSRMILDAKRRGLEFTVSIERLWELFLAQDRKCAFTDYPLDFGTGKNGRGRTASLDRIDSRAGYIDGNVQWVHRRVNVMKQDMTTEQFIALCGLVIDKFKGMEMKHTNPGIVDPQSASESLVIPAIDYHRRKRPMPRKQSMKWRLENGKVPPLDQQTEDRVLALYRENYTIRAISMQTGVHRSRVAWLLQKHGIVYSGWKGRKTAKSVKSRE